MDETLGALDRRLREECQFEPRRIQQDLRSRIQQVATPEVRYEEPEREIGGGLIVDNNILRGRIKAVGDGVCEIETPDGIVKAFPVHACNPGEDEVVAIRPERVGLARPGVLRNGFEARVDGIPFLGDHLRLRLNPCGNPDFIVKIPNTVGRGALLEGDRVGVGWAMTDCRALPLDAAPGTARQGASHDFP